MCYYANNIKLNILKIEINHLLAGKELKKYVFV